MSNELFYDYYIGRKFMYLPHFLEVFRQYEEQNTYASFIDFLPQVVSSLSQIDVKETKKHWKNAKDIDSTQVVPPSINAIHPSNNVKN